MLFEVSDRKSQNSLEFFDVPNLFCQLMEAGEKEEHHE